MEEKFSATKFIKNKKRNLGCLACKNWHKENNLEICLKSDKFILPDFRPYNCDNFEEV